MRLRAVPVMIEKRGIAHGVRVAIGPEGGDKALVLDFRDAALLFNEIGSVMDAIKEEQPELAAKDLSEGIEEDCDCDRCQVLMDELAGIVKLSGACPSHGVALADDVGCPLCDQEMASQGEETF